jgi:hypothetical protein
LDLTETAVRRWVAQADIDAGRRDGLTTTKREELSNRNRGKRVSRKRVAPLMRTAHRTTGHKLLEAFPAHEQGALLALPPKPWEPVRWTTAKVHADCHLQVENARYSVPYRYVGHRLDVRLSRSTVEIYTGAELVATYLRRYQGRSTRMEH